MFCSSSLFAQNEQINWQKDFGEAVKVAKNQDKLILLFFTGSDWCGPCKMLVNDFFITEKFKNITDESFVLYEADFPRNKNLITDSERKDNLKLARKYSVTSYPTVVIINAKGKLINKRKGYNLMRDPSYHYNLLEDSIK